MLCGPKNWNQKRLVSGTIQNAGLHSCLLLSNNDEREEHGVLGRP
jgi:hypothetical protein